MMERRVACRVASPTRWSKPRNSGVVGSASATKVLHSSCTSLWPGISLYAVEAPGGNASANPVHCPGVGVRADGVEGGACRAAWRQAVRLTVLTLMSLATKGRESEVLA
jgi:hypothetical protein